MGVSFFLRIDLCTIDDGTGLLDCAIRKKVMRGVETEREVEHRIRSCPSVFVWLAPSSLHPIPFFPRHVKMRVTCVRRLSFHCHSL